MLIWASVPALHLRIRQVKGVMIPLKVWLFLSIMQPMSVGAPPEKQFLSTSFVPADLNAWSYSFQFEAQGTRIFYVIANYDGSVLKRTDGTVVTLSADNAP